MIETIISIVALAIGFGIAYFIGQKKIWRIQKENFSQNRDLEKELAILNERIEQLTDDNSRLISDVSNFRNEKIGLLQQHATIKAENKTLLERLENQKSELEQLQKRFTLEFEHIATKILRENSEEINTTNQKRLGDLLTPLKEKISAFEKKVEETYEKETRDKISLKEEVKRLYELNSRISDEANNLTKALRGDVKKQGNWGEIILERILERSGLTKDSEYKREVVLQNDEGANIRPDAIIYLPEEKHIIVDAKVSLNAYERYVEANDNTEKDRFAKEHILSLKNHVKELANKHYSNLAGLNTPDFVLMFVPIESSFAVAVQYDQELFGYAWDNKIIIVSPSTLLATLRTIASIWKQENQNKNVLEIAKKGGELYDKFVGFVTDMENIGKQIAATQKNYDAALNKLQTGKGNLIRRTEQLKELGAKAKKQLPSV